MWWHWYQSGCKPSGQDKLKELICFFSFSTSSGTIQHWALNEWSYRVQPAPGGEGSSNAEGISHNHVAHEWWLLSRWKLLTVHLAKLGSLVTGNIFKYVLYSPPSLACFWLLKTDLCKVTVVTGACRRVGEMLFSTALWNPECTLSWKMSPCYSLPTSRQFSVFHFFKCSPLMQPQYQSFYLWVKAKTLAFY